jgi:hypothetical protein
MIAIWHSAQIKLDIDCFTDLVDIDAVICPLPLPFQTRYLWITRKFASLCKNHLYPPAVACGINPECLLPKLAGYYVSLG